MRLRAETTYFLEVERERAGVRSLLQLHCMYDILPGGGEEAERGEIKERLEQR
jgi:hypothetical protein